MHITLISQCEKKALIKTRAILDRYAIRTGRRTWTTSITKEALMEIHSALTRKATRQTAVACFVNRGSRAMRLLWTVGNKRAFGSHGEVPIATRVGTIRPERVWLTDALHLAQTAGLLHDLGKMSVDFSSKISPSCTDKNRSDPIRHEILSSFIVKSLLDGESWDAAWPSRDFTSSEVMVNAYGTVKEPKLLREVDSVQNALLFLIATHHHLFTNSTSERHVRPANGKTFANAKKDPLRNETPIMRIAESSISSFLTKFSDEQANKTKWAGLALYARAALILADQKGSSDCSNPKGAEDDHEFYANTTKNSSGKSAYNQTLSRHLSMIGAEAKKMVLGMAQSPITPLSANTKEGLLRHSAEEYKWQNLAAKALTPGRPSLVLNVAATGAGKTRMNLRAAAVLSADAPFAVTTALGLRTLTLQTGDSYKQDMGIKGDEIAVIIGCTATRKLHEYERDDEASVANPEGSPDDEEDLIVTAYGGKTHDLPPYLQGFKKAQDYAPVLTAPVLVSTIDYVVAAGDLTKKAGHGLALLRLMHSDLIIDEIDGFEPKGLAAILRIVKISAMFGRSVIASSGTLPVVVARYLLMAYEAGHKVYAEMNEVAASFGAIIIDDSIPPLPLITPDAEQFAKAYQEHLERLQMALADKPITKKATLIDSARSQGEIDMVIADTVSEMHRRHAWTSSFGKKVSIGLIRIANIKNAIRVARDLSKCDSTHVVCYHARHFMIQRAHIERKLDRLLSRKKDNGVGGNEWMRVFEADSDIARILKASTGDVKIIVVATPVEEVGRDHDFDWAIIEPSSTQSIVQTAGRVNRHRKGVVSCPNVGILRFNFRACDGQEDAFCRPGYENRGSHRFPDKEHKGEEHDVSRLIDFSLIGDKLDSSLRFDEKAHPFSRLDSKGIEDQLKAHADFFINWDARWMSSQAYFKAALREKGQNTVELYVQKDSHSATDAPPDLFERDVESNGSRKISSLMEWQVPPLSRMLFGLSLEEMVDMGRETGIGEQVGLTIHCHENCYKYIFSSFGCEEEYSA